MTAAAAAAAATTAPAPKIDTMLVASLNAMAYEYSKYNTEDGEIEDTITRNRRWAQLVRLLLLFKPDVCCMQEVSRAWLAYAFGGILPVDPPAAPKTPTVPTPEQIAEVKNAAGALLDVYECVWTRRTFPEGHVPKHGIKPDGCAIIYRRDKYAPPKFAGAPEDEKTVLSALVDAENAAGGKQKSLPPQLTSPFAPTHFKTLKSSGDPRNSIAVALRTLNGVPVGTFVSLHLEGAQNSDGKLDMTMLRAVQYKEAAMGAAKLSPAFSSPFIVVLGDFNDPKAALMEPEVKDLGLTFTALPKPMDADAPAADSYTAIYGPIDYLSTNDPARLVGPLQVYPKPQDRKKNPKGVVPGRNGALPSPYLPPPYLDSSWPTDHYLLVQRLKVQAGDKRSP
jgi:hypothetical protein